MLKKALGTNIFIAFLDLSLIAVFISDWGMEGRFFQGNLVSQVFPVFLLLLIIFNFYKFFKFRYDDEIRSRARPSLIFLLLLFLTNIFWIIADYHGSWVEAVFKPRPPLEYGILFYFLLRLTFLIRIIYKIYFNPAIIFIGSFALIAIAGAFLLLLPGATLHKITFTDALFTATSAVSVNGLMVLDLGTEFTTFGYVILMILFQIGGLGMLTFTSFFAYFFKSGSSVKESIFMQNMLGYNRISNILTTTMRIVVFSLIVEAVGALFIYNSLGDTVEDSIFFSIFHSISAYCNAGITLNSDSLQGLNFRYNYYLQWILMTLVVFGGLGYSVASNFVQYVRQILINLFLKKKKKSISRLITLNTKIAVYATIFLIVGGTIFFIISEWNTAIDVHQSFFGKFTTASFSSITARTAGFNTFDYAQFTIPGLLVTMFLMWVGASPASTGGGIKTTTFALATLNVFSVARNKESIEIGTRRVSYDSVRRAFAIIIISLIAIGVGILSLLILNPEFTLMQVAFETFGAFSTTGLSMGITPEVTVFSKYIIMFLMFFGRIGFINLITGILKNVQREDYKYPKENILIN